MEYALEEAQAWLSPGGRVRDDVLVFFFFSGCCDLVWDGMEFQFLLGSKPWLWDEERKKNKKREYPGLI